MTTEQKRNALGVFCKEHRHTHHINTTKEICPFEHNEFCQNYTINEAPPEIIDQWYELFFGKDISAPTIKDSGNRTEFPTGAVRDIQEGKGRCDLMPLDVVAEYFNNSCNGRTYTLVFDYIYEFQRTGDGATLIIALGKFVENHWGDGKTMLLEVAKHFEEGAKKYGENNWQKGIPLSRYVDSAVRHYLKWLRGDKDEPHDRAFCWNIMCATWTCKHLPELNDYAVGVSE